MDIQNILVDSGIAALVLIQVGKLVNGYLQRSKVVDQIGEYVSGGIEVASSGLAIAQSAVDAFEDDEITQEELDAVMGIVKQIKQRRAQ